MVVCSAAAVLGLMCRSSTLVCQFSRAKNGRRLPQLGGFNNGQPQMLRGFPKHYTQAVVSSRPTLIRKLYTHVADLGARYLRSVDQHIATRVPRALTEALADFNHINRSLSGWGRTDLVLLVAFLWRVRFGQSSVGNNSMSSTAAVGPENLQKSGGIEVLLAPAARRVPVAIAPQLDVDLEFEDRRRWAIADHTEAIRIGGGAMKLAFETPAAAQPVLDIDRILEFRRLLGFSHAVYERNAADAASIAHVDPGHIVIMHPAADADRLLPAFLVAIDEKLQAVVVSVRGTWSWQDALINFLAVPEPINGGTAHRGMLAVAQHLIEHLFEKHGLAKLLADRPTYSLRLVGHSLGGGIAALMAMLLKLRYPDVHAYAFHAPACVSASLSASCAPFVTSILNGDDIIPRFHLESTEAMRKELQQVDWAKEIAAVAGVDKLIARLPSIPAVSMPSIPVPDVIANQAATVAGVFKGLSSKLNIGSGGKTAAASRSPGTAAVGGVVVDAEVPTHGRSPRHHPHHRRDVSNVNKVAPINDRVDSAEAAGGRGTARVVNEAQALSSSITNLLASASLASSLQQLGDLIPQLKPLLPASTGTVTADAAASPNATPGAVASVVPGQAGRDYAVGVAANTDESLAATIGLDSAAELATDASVDAADAYGVEDPSDAKLVESQFVTQPSLAMVVSKLSSSAGDATVVDTPPPTSASAAPRGRSLLGPHPRSEDADAAGSFNESMQFYVPGTIFWFYYPPGYTRRVSIIEESRKKMEKIRKEAASQNRQHLSPRLNSEASTATAKRKRQRTQHSRLIVDDGLWPQDDIEGLTGDAADDAGAVPESAATTEAAVDVRGIVADGMLTDSGAYVGGIMLQVSNFKGTSKAHHKPVDNPALRGAESQPHEHLIKQGKRLHIKTTAKPQQPEVLGADAKSADSATSARPSHAPTPASSIDAADSFGPPGHSFFKSIQMSKWMFTDHGAQAMEFEMDRYIVWLQQQQQQQQREQQ